MFYKLKYNPEFEAPQNEKEEMIVAVNAVYAIAQKSCWRGFT